MNLNIESIAWLVLPFAVTYGVYRIVRNLKINVLLWLLNCLVFVVIVGVELIAIKYFQEKTAATKKDSSYIKYDDSASRYEPYYVSTNQIKK